MNDGFVIANGNGYNKRYVLTDESKKIVSGEGMDSQVSFEKHKIFLYKEDFGKFMEGLQQAIQFIADEQGLPEPRPEDMEATEEEATESLSESEIKIDIDF